MNAINNQDRPFTFRFLDTKPRILLELKNTTEIPLRSIEILTIFLKDDEAPDSGLAQVQIRFDVIKSMRPGDSAVLSHRTWINGKPVNDERDQLERLKLVAGVFTPYVLDITWQNAEGKARFQRIPVGH
jgi:hypothetical protein